MDDLKKKIEKLEKENKKLKKKIEQLEKENEEIKEKIKSYTNTDRHKRYYEKNKDIITKKARAYIDKVKQNDPGRIKEYQHTAYLNRKSKLKKEND